MPHRGPKSSGATVLAACSSFNGEARRTFLDWNHKLRVLLVLAAVQITKGVERIGQAENGIVNLQLRIYNFPP